MTENGPAPPRPPTVRRGGGGGGDLAPTHLRQGCGSEAGILLPADRMLLIVKKKWPWGK